jgi:2'-5' RNA ligase
MGVEDMSPGKVQGSPLQLLHQILSQELDLRGFVVEMRPFSPHLTLARIKRPLTPHEQQRLQRLLHSKQAGASSPIYSVKHLCIMKSELSRSGAKYTCLKECPFSKFHSLLPE